MFQRLVFEAVSVPFEWTMRRREIILFLAGSVLARSNLVSAQQPGRPRRIGVVMLYPENDPQGELRANAFRDQLEKAGWTIGGNLQVDFQWGTGDADWVHSATERALHQAPDVLLANGDAAVHSALQLTKTVPVIFIGSGDPVADGLVQTLSHPGGNITGFAVMEPSLGSKLLGMLKQIAPHVTRVAVLLNPDNATHKHVLTLLRTAAPGLGVKLESAPARDRAEIEVAMSRLGSDSNYGVIVPSDPTTNSQRKLFIEFAARYRLPTIYALRAAVADGGLMSYGVDLIELFRQAAIYADRILKGEKPADLPVQLPAKFEMTVNLKTARTLGLDVPPSLLATADEVIE
jgi:putative tryptophan/tyrosine transport system substrate-binding protein